MFAVKRGGPKAALTLVLLVLLAAVPGGGVAFAAVPTYSYSVGTPFGVGTLPYGVVVDSGTHTAYVTNTVQGGSVSVIDEASNTVTDVFRVGFLAEGVALDPTTHTLYLSNFFDNSLTVVDAASHTVTATITVGSGPAGVAVDPVTHTVYVANEGDGSALGSVSVIDAASNTVTATVGVGLRPYGVAVDPLTHTVYVANQGDGIDGVDDGSVSVIDGSSDTVTATITGGQGPYGVAVDPGSNLVYVSNQGETDGPDTVSVIKGGTNTVTGTISVGGAPAGVAIDPATRTVYVTNLEDGTVSVIDEASGVVTATVGVGGHPYAVAVDPVDHTVYAASFTDNTVVVITQQPVTGSPSQTIGFTSTPPAHPAQGGSYRVSATGGGSGNPVTYTLDASSTAGACSVNDHGDSTATVSFTGLGSCVVDANQAAAPGYTAAPEVRQSMSVGPAALDHLTISPATAAVAPGAWQSYTAQGFDRFGNSLGDVTDATSFQIQPDGACADTSCTATVAGEHTITGVDGVSSGTATLTVAPVAVDVVTPISGSAQSVRPGRRFPTPLVASVTDQLGHPASGAPVTFTVTTGSARFRAGRAVTVRANDAGVATALSLRAGRRSGPVTVLVASGKGSGVFPASVIGSRHAKADLSVTLTAPIQVQTGSTLTLKVTVDNRGRSTARSTQTAVAIPAGFSITDTGGGTQHGSSVLFTGPRKLSAHASRTYTIHLTADRRSGSTDATIRGAAVSTTKDPRRRNNTDTTTIRVS